jgi:PKD repeat protein
MARRRTSWRCACGLLVGASLVGFLQISAVAPAAADTAPVDPGEPVTVAADALPTVQTDGVVWAQVVVGDRVYVTGEFTLARRAGSPPGVDETPRQNLLAFDIHTGELIESWAPGLDAQGTAITASEDGSIVYVGGDFGQVNGEWRPRIAAIDAQTGQVLAFNPVANVRVAALAVRGDTLYLGGHFTMVSNQPRSRVAAVHATTGALLPWAPTVDSSVVAMTVHQPSGRVIIGGNFSTVNGVVQRGMTSLDGSTGALMPWVVNTIVTNYGSQSYISGLTNDGDMVYGVGWNFGSGGGAGNFEGVFAADPLTGELDWVTGCRGDTYGITTHDEVIYTVSHAHDCGMVGDFPETNPFTFQRAQAFRKGRGPSGLANAYGSNPTWQHFPGRPAADVLHWLPSIALGSYTGQFQGAWSIASNDDYLVLGGEFPRVNGQDQYGLVRFAKREIAPNRDQIQGYPELAPTLTPMGPGSVRVGWTAAWDRDNRRLTVEVLRGPTTASSTVLTTFETDTTWWRRPPLGFLDTTAPPGSQQTYRIRVRDAFGNGFAGPPATITIPAGSPTDSTYASMIRADSPRHHWRLNETSGTLARDSVSSSDLTLGAGVTRNTPGALLNETDRAATWPGSSSTTAVQGTTGQWESGPQTFSIEAWVRTTTTLGGKIIGFGDRRTTRSTTNGADRHLYLTNNGQFRFGVRPDMGERQTITSAAGYNDGQWHHVVGTLSDAGMQLYVDGVLVAEDPSITRAQVFWGYWRVGGDRLTSWPSAPTREAINASIDEIAVYPHALSEARVRAHYQASGRGGGLPNDPPVAAFTTQTSDLTVTLDGSASHDPDGTITAHAWDFGDGTTGTGETTQHTYEAAGTYTVTLTVTDNDDATHEVTTTVTVTEPPPQFALDRFERSEIAGLGTAERGGPWTTTGPGSSYAVDDGAGRITGAVAANRAAYLAEVTQTDQDITVDLSLDRPATGGGSYTSIVARRVAANTDYRAQVRHLAGGSIALTVTRTVNGATTTLASQIVPGLTTTPDVPIRLRFQVVGTDVTTAGAKVWPVDASEPTDWTLTHTGDTPDALRQPGHLGVLVYLSGSWTGTPATVSIDNLTAEPTMAGSSGAPGDAGP